MTRQDPTAGRLTAGHLPQAAAIERLFEQAADIAIHVGPDAVVRGISVNPDTPSLGCLDHWVGRPLAQFLTEESREKFALRLADMTADPARTPRPIELNHVDNATWEFPVRYSLHRVTGEGAVLMLGRDMQPIAEVQQRLVKEQMARERDQQKLRAETTFYRVVLEASETPFVLVEPQRGRIHDLNSAAAGLLGTKADTLVGTAFAQAFEGMRPGDLMERLQVADGTQEAGAGMELVARRNGRVLMVLPQHFRAAGDLFVLCRLTAVDADEGGGAEMAQAMSAFFGATADAVALTDGKGLIREANEAFLVLADAAQLRDVRGRPLSDFLVRGAIDLRLLLDTARSKGRMRNYATHLVSVVGARTPVEVTVAHLTGRGGDLGYGFTLRDRTGAEMPEGGFGAVAVSEEAMKHVMDLVGTASLKDLVSATSDVIEKLCIETAVQLTGNNRVAAAEMLGMSRQSLYVKLRKHGMLVSDGEE